MIFIFQKVNIYITTKVTYFWFTRITKHFYNSFYKIIYISSWLSICNTYSYIFYLVHTILLLNTLDNCLMIMKNHLILYIEIQS